MAFCGISTLFAANNNPTPSFVVGRNIFLLQIFIVVVCCQSLGENDDWWKINWRWQTPQHICDVQLNWLAVGKTKLAVSRIKANNFNGHWPSNRLASEAEIKYVLRKLTQWIMCVSCTSMFMLDINLCNRRKITKQVRRTYFNSKYPIDNFLSMSIQFTNNNIAAKM